MAAAAAAVVAASTEAHRSEATVLDVHDLRVAAAVGQPVDVEAAAAAVVAAVVAVVVAVEAEEAVVEEAEVAVVEEAEVAAGVAVAVEVVVQSKPWSNHTGTLAFLWQRRARRM